jgi:hypothetical protein
VQGLPLLVVPVLLELLEAVITTSCN